MEFRIADTFTDSLSKLTGQEQRAIKTTAFDLQMNPANPGIQFHKLDKIRDPNFWSVRVSRDIRLIVHRTESSLLLCYVDHHDDAYKWAERRKLEVHPKTGAAQLVEIRETIKEVTVPVYVEEERPKPPKPILFESFSDDQLLEFGVPPEWLKEVRRCNEDTLLEIADHLPNEAAEALLDIATGVTPQKPQPVGADIDPFDHPDAKRRFRVMSNIDELKRALDYPWEKWTTFLHPAQQKIVEYDYNGSARVSGSAGTGKTIVALHRSVFLARKNPDARILLTTFSEPLANMLRIKLRRLINNEPRLGERIEVYSVNEIGKRLYETNIDSPQIATPEHIRQIISKASGKTDGHKFALYFLVTEWEQVVDAWQLEAWETYRDVRRLGRKTRLPESHRSVLWSIFEIVRSDLKKQGLITHSELFSRLSSRISESDNRPYNYIIVDESQDVSVPQLRFLSALGSHDHKSLFFAGDLGQRIFQQPFSWKSLGVDIRGRSQTLRINYRTSHQIRIQADRLLAGELSDVDGIEEKRTGTISVFNGPQPSIMICKTQDAEIEKVSKWLADNIEKGLKPGEIGCFVRSESELERARNAVENAGLSFKILDKNIEISSEYISISTMHLAKGLEFRAVAVMACDDEVIPSQARIETVTDDADLEEVYNTERHLLYVACTRARDNLLITGVNPASEFLDDLSS